MLNDQSARPAAWKCIFLKPKRMLVLALLMSFLLLSGASAASSGTIRVRLNRLGAPSTIRMQANCDYVLSGNVQMNIPAGSVFTVSLSGNGLQLSVDGVSVQCAQTLKLLRCGSGNQGIRFLSPSLANLFCGDLYLSASGASIGAILYIDLENYLYGVVGYEMSNSFPLEALKAQSVAARNFALNKMNSRAASSYDLTDGTADQVFRGYNASYARVIQAVDETRGQALYAGGKLASCYYTASNGGQTESTRNVWGGKLSYSTVKDDPYDLQNASAKKSTAVIARNGENLNADLQAALLQGAAAALEAADVDADTAKITEIMEITPCNSKYESPSRLYKTLRFTIALEAQDAQTGEKTEVSAQIDIPTYGGLESWYGLSINTASNETVAVEEDETSFRIVFRRWGHGVGMSQRGAQTMATAYGMGYREILEFYYPGTELKKLELDSMGSHSAVSMEEGAIAEAGVSQEAQLFTAPNSDSALATLSAGVRLKLYEVQGDWARVNVLGLAGYVPLKNLSGIPEPTATPTPEPTEAPTQEPTEAPTPEPTEVPTPEPTEVPTLEPTEAPTPEPTEAPTPEPTATATPQPTQGFAPQPTAVDHPMPTPVPAPDGAEGMLVATGEMYATVSTSSGGTLTLRKSPYTSAKALGYLRNGEQVKLLAFDDDWACVYTSSDLRGFASRKYLLLPGENRQPVAEDTPLEKKDDSEDQEEADEKGGFREIETDIIICDLKARTQTAVKLYKSASTASAVLQNIKASARVDVMAYNSKWAYVKNGSHKGFVLLKYLKAE